MLNTCGLAVQNFGTSLWVKNSQKSSQWKTATYTQIYATLNNKLTTFYSHYYNTSASVFNRLYTQSTGL